MSLTWLFTNLVAGFFLPPLNGLLLAGTGFFLQRRRPRTGRWLIGLGLLLILLQGLPFAAKSLIAPLETRYSPLSLDAVGDAGAGAVVILGSGRYRRAPEFAGVDDLKQLALERVRYGALVAKTSGLPVLVTGGHPDGTGDTEADIMARVLARDFGVSVRWRDGDSNNTRENAVQSAAILQAAGITRVIVVTHAFHMPRAAAAFARAGLEVVPAPMAYLSARPASLMKKDDGDSPTLDFLPSYAASRDTGLALHEWIGLLWYSLTD